MAERHSRSVASSAIEYATVTEHVALRVAPLGGAGVPERAYPLAMETLRQELEAMPFCGRVAILREERLNEKGEVHSLVASAGTLNVGDTLGTADPSEGEVDLAVEPIEGLTPSLARATGFDRRDRGGPEGTMLRTPDMYMSKLIVGPNSRGRIDIDASVSENIRAIAEGHGRRPSEITVAVLERERHEDLVEQIRETGARIQLRQEGDLTPAIAVGLRGAGLHAIIGVGGAPEGILAAAVVRCLGGEMQAKMWPTQRSQVEKLKEYGLDDPEKKLTMDDLIRSSDVVFAATGITSGEILNGVRYFRGGGRTHSMVMSTEPRMVRFMDTIHALEPEAGTQGFQL